MRTVRVGPAADPATIMGPLIAPPGPNLRRALTTLEPGESWLVEPRQLDSEGRLWSPGVRRWVHPGSWFRVTACFGPVLGLVRAADLDEAIRLQNATSYGLTAGLHSLGGDEIDKCGTCGGYLSGYFHLAIRLAHDPSYQFFVCHIASIARRAASGLRTIRTATSATRLISFT